jgi:hypothetical protein
LLVFAPLAGAAVGAAGAGVDWVAPPVGLAAAVGAG